jgi:Zn-dependent peptidase ImmA (M78 family)
VGSEAARLILAHELGHIVLAHGSSYHKQSDGQESFCIAEWEADEFAAELLMPSKVALQMGPETLARFFAVPLRSAQLRLETLKNRMNISSAKSIPRYEHHIDLLSKFDKDLLYWVPMRQRQVG